MTEAAALLCLDVNIVMTIPLIIYLGICLSEEVYGFGIHGFFSGLSSAFRNDIYNTSIGYTMQFHDVSLVGLAGVMLGIGELTGSAICAALNSRMPHITRGKIVTTGILINYLAYLLISLNIPPEADVGPTDNTSVIKPPKYCFKNN